MTPLGNDFHIFVLRVDIFQYNAIYSKDAHVFLVGLKWTFEFQVICFQLLFHSWKGFGQCQDWWNLILASHVFCSDHQGVEVPVASFRTPPAGLVTAKSFL